MNPMYYILIGVIFLVVAIDLYVKNKNKKSDSTNVDFPLKKEKSNNVLIISIGSLLVVLIVGFFVADKFYYDSRLTNNDDQFSFVEIIKNKKYKLTLNHDYFLPKFKEIKLIQNGIIVDENNFYVGLIVNGNKEGLWQSFYNSGVKRTAVNYINGNIEGKVLKFHQNGKKHYEGWYENNQINGEITIWFRNGTILEKSSFIEGKRHGLTEYFNVDGSLESIANFNYGRYSGLQKTFDNGIIYIEELHVPIIGKNVKGRYCISCSYPTYSKQYENGNLYMSTHYKFVDREYSPYEKDYVLWYENDRVTQKQFYRNGKEYGRRIFY
jgi:antitoxin component YwqK of YwqJK toxin-antitoxin module